MHADAQMAVSQASAPFVKEQDSSIAGRGLFAGCYIAASSFVLEYEVNPQSELHSSSDCDSVQDEQLVAAHTSGRQHARASGLCCSRGQRLKSGTSLGLQLAALQGELISNRQANMREQAYRRQGLGEYLFRLNRATVIDPTMTQVLTVSVQEADTSKPCLLDGVRHVSLEPCQQLSGRVSSSGSHSKSCSFCVGQARWHKCHDCRCAEPCCVCRSARRGSSTTAARATATA